MNKIQFTLKSIQWQFNCYRTIIYYYFLLFILIIVKIHKTNERLNKAQKLNENSTIRGFSPAKIEKRKYQSRSWQVRQNDFSRNSRKDGACEQKKKKKLTRNKGGEEAKAKEQIDVHLSQQVCRLISRLLSDVVGPRI